MKTPLSSFRMNLAVIAAIFAGLTAAAPASAQLQDALDNTSLTFTGDPGPSNEQWYRVTNVSHDGVDSARSGTFVDTGSDSGFSTTVTGPGTISFWWKVSSQPNADLLYFFDNSSMKAYIGGEVDWEYRSFAVDAGTHTLTWSYMKDYAVSQGSDCGWVDQVVWTTGAPDTTPPGDVSNFTLEAGDRMIGMSWTNPGDADLAGVKILRKEGGWPAGPTDGTTVFDGVYGRRSRP